MKLKRILYGFLALLGATLIGVCIYLNSLLPIITGYAAKNLCSAVFVSGRTQQDVESVDLNFSFIKYTKNEIDYKDKSVTSHFLWGKSEALYRDGFGVTLLRDVSEKVLDEKKFPHINKPGYSQDTIAWPMGDILPDTIVTGIDVAALNNVSKKLFADSGYNGNAFAFMVLYKGLPVAEEYKPQFNKTTRFLSWSMGKSFINALIGILVKDGEIDIYKEAAIEEWKDDERSKITLNDLMQMQSGLKWNEDYGNRSDVTLMLHREGDMARFAFEKSLEYPAGTHWYYSSGTTNIVSHIIHKQFDNDSAYYSFVYTRLFDKTGMPDVIFETDPSGTIVGSSYLYATARDYARFALLYQNDGVFNGERILPEGWVDYTRTEASASNGEYGSFFWLNKCKKLPSAPEDMYMCVGHDGQRIFILPTQQLIVVVLGYSRSSNGGMDFDSLLKDILSTLVMPEKGN
jgi:CubicO group peptidase (beta-lactamase class C family)